jgi:nuclear cap-binding protein subunit 2
MAIELTLDQFLLSNNSFRTSKNRDEVKARISYDSRTVYVGNLAFVTTDSQLHALFSRAGNIERIIMGLNANTKTPCGFAFVLYSLRTSAIDAVRYLNGTILDERNIKVEMDKGFYEGRQYGRGETGGQVRDEFRSGFDEGRGGYSVMEQNAVSAGVPLLSSAPSSSFNSGFNRGNKRRQPYSNQPRPFRQNQPWNSGGDNNSQRFSGQKRQKDWSSQPQYQQQQQQQQSSSSHDSEDYHGRQDRSRFMLEENEGDAEPKRRRTDVGDAENTENRVDGVLLDEFGREIVNH